MTQLKPQYILVLLSVFIASACSGQSKAPSDQVIEGVFKITNEWQSITFDQPLTSIPHLQFLRLLFCNQQMDFLLGDPDNPVPEEQKGYFIRTEDNELFKPEVLAIIDNKNYSLSQTSLMWYTMGQFSGCRAIGYSLEGKGNALYLPEGASIKSVSIRSNLEIPIDFFHWSAPYFERAPNAKWSTTHSSKIIDLDDLPE